MEFFYMVEINNGIAMHTHKKTRVERCEQFPHTLPKQVKSLPHVHPNMFAQRLYPQDIFNPDDDDSFIGNYS